MWLYNEKEWALDIKMVYVYKAKKITNKGNRFQRIVLLCITISNGHNIAIIKNTFYGCCGITGKEQSSAAISKAFTAVNILNCNIF